MRGGSGYPVCERTSAAVENCSRRTNMQVIVIGRAEWRHPKKRSCLNRESQSRKARQRAARKRPPRRGSRWQAGVAGAAPPQLPTLLQRTTDFADRHVDAERGAVVAGLPADRFGVAAGVGGIRQPDPCVSVCAAGRNHCRSRQPPPHRDLPRKSRRWCWRSFWPR